MCASRQSSFISLFSLDRKAIHCETIQRFPFAIRLFAIFLYFFFYFFLLWGVIFTSGHISYVVLPIRVIYDRFDYHTIISWNFPCWWANFGANKIVTANQFSQCYSFVHSRAVPKNWLLSYFSSFPVLMNFWPTLTLQKYMRKITSQTLRKFNQLDIIVRRNCYVNIR